MSLSAIFDLADPKVANWFFAPLNGVACLRVKVPLFFWSNAAKPSAKKDLMP